MMKQNNRGENKEKMNRSKKKFDKQIIISFH